MAHRRLIPAIVRYRLTPWWLRVAAVWLLSRVVTTALLLLFAAWQPSNAWTGDHPSYLDFSQLWDSTWYHIVAVSGYPSILPFTADGHVAQNAWAFLPAYPSLVRGLMMGTGLSWPVLSVFVSVVFSLAAALVFARLMRRVLPAASVLFSVVLFCFGPLSPMLQVSYAESMYLFLLAVALLLVLDRRYAALFPVVAVMSLTRPSGLAFALMLALHVVHRWWMRRRDPFPAAQAWLAVGVTAFSLVMGLAWPLLAWAVTGEVGAYTQTELAWRADYLGYRDLLPFAAWIQGAEFWGAQWQLGAGVYVLLGIVVALFFVGLFTPWVRRLGVDLRLWLASYALYLLAVFFPQSSTFRLLMPMFPLAGALALPRSRLFRVTIVVLFVAGQYVWIYLCWWVNGYDWMPP